MERPVNAKSSHQAVNYEAESTRKGEQCSRCEHFIDAEPPRCETVASPIASKGWCKRFDDRGYENGADVDLEELRKRNPPNPRRG